MSKIKNIIFDLDGTLWDSRSQIIAAWQNVMPSIKINKNQLKDLMGKTSAEFINYLFPNYTIEDADAIMKKCELEEVNYLNKHGAKLYDNVLSIIKDLHKTYKLFIVSNCQDGYIESFLTYYNLSKYFTDIECNGKTNKSKSENITLLIQRNKLNTYETCYIGDTENDYIASLNNNIKFIWCKYGFGNIKDYKLLVNAPNEISKLLKTLE